MTSEETTQLQSELEELRFLISQSKFARTKEVLSRQIFKVEADIAAIKVKIAKREAEDSGQIKTKVKIQLTEHAFDQSEKYAKVFIPFNHGNELSDDNVKIDFTENSFHMLAQTDEKDYCFVVTSLLKKIDIDKSYKKVKPDMISIYMKKVKDGEKWDCLTLTEKRLKDQKKKVLDEDKEEAGADPMGGLMNIMKKMYDSGDSEMKRTIAKAWTEGQDKRNNPMP